MKATIVYEVFHFLKAYIFIKKWAKEKKMIPFWVKNRKKNAISVDRKWLVFLVKLKLQGIV